MASLIIFFTGKIEKQEKLLNDVDEPRTCNSTPQRSSSDEHSLSVPDGVGKGSYYSKPSLPTSGCYIELYVTYTVHPHSFWIILIKDWPKLEALSEDLR